MYESKYKHKHADRRARLFPEKVEVVEEPRKVAGLASQFASSSIQGLQRQRELSSFSAQQQAQKNPCGIGSLFGAGAFFGGLR